MNGNTIDRLTVVRIRIARMHSFISSLSNYTIGTINKYRLPKRAFRKLDRVIQEEGSEPGRIRILNWDLEYTDPRALRAMLLSQVFERINDFTSSNAQPYVLDCGANIGISVLRTKQLYPEARILAFEPDPDICQILRRNLQRNHAADVAVVEAAVWTDHTGVSFRQEGTVSGHILSCANADIGTQVLVSSVALADYISEPVDFLKLDIEGAELEVLRSCKDRLPNIQKMVVEVHYELANPAFLAEILALLTDAHFRVSIYCTKRIDLVSSFKRRPQRNADQHPILYAWR